MVTITYTKTGTSKNENLDDTELHQQKMILKNGYNNNVEIWSQKGNYFICRTQYEY